MSEMLEQLAADMRAMAGVKDAIEHRDGDTHVTRIEVELVGGYGHLTVYNYGRIYWTHTESNDSCEFHDLNWPVIMRIKQWLDERYPDDPTPLDDQS